MPCATPNYKLMLGWAQHDGDLDEETGCDLTCDTDLIGLEIEQVRKGWKGRCFSFLLHGLFYSSVSTECIGL
jgi:hypothetical protein